MTTPSKAQARIVPADQPEAWPFAPGDVVRDSGEDGDDAAWLDAAPQRTVLVDHQGTEWKRLGDGWFLADAHQRIGRWASLNLNETYGPLSVVRVGDGLEHVREAARQISDAVGQTAEEFAADIRKDPVGMVARAVCAPATPAVGAGTSEGAAGSQIGVHESGLGDALRAWAETPSGPLATDAFYALADRADELEAAYRVADAEIARLSEFHDHYRDQVERVRALADDWESRDRRGGYTPLTPAWAANALRAALEGPQ